MVGFLGKQRDKERDGVGGLRVNDAISSQFAHKHNGVFLYGLMVKWSLCL